VRLPSARKRTVSFVKDTGHLGRVSGRNGLEMEHRLTRREPRRRVTICSQPRCGRLDGSAVVWRRDGRDERVKKSAVGDEGGSITGDTADGQNNNRMAVSMQSKSALEPALRCREGERRTTSVSRRWSGIRAWLSRILGRSGALAPGLSQRLFEGGDHGVGVEAGAGGLDDDGGTMGGVVDALRFGCR
jgi:hypothetical protein